MLSCAARIENTRLCSVTQKLLGQVEVALAGGVGSHAFHRKLFLSWGVCGVGTQVRLPCGLQGHCLAWEVRSLYLQGP